MSDTDHREASIPVPATRSLAIQTSLSADNKKSDAEDADVGVPDPLLSNFAPLPSALGVTYSLI